jgi:glycosyltransferase involved in cell wall biosynthesis
MKITAKENKNYIFKPLMEPTLITEQIWPENTLPIVATSTLTFNHEPYIRDCIEGILMQKTTFPVKIVIFEDFSTDKTKDILVEYEQKYPQLFKVFYMPFNTYGKTIRREMASPFREEKEKAKYIAHCEGDDYWTDPLKLQKQVELMERVDDAVAVCASVSYLYEGKSRLNFDYQLKKRDGRDYFLLEEVIYHGGGLIPTCSLMYKMDILKNKPEWFSNSPTGDYALNIFLATLGKVYFLEDNVATYRALSINSWTDQNRKLHKVLSTNRKLIAFLKILNKETNEMHSKIIRKKQQRLLISTVVELLKWIPYKIFKFLKKQF